MATQTLTMTRGDSAAFKVSASMENGSIRPFDPGDTIYFTVKKTTDTPDVIIQKIIKDFDETGAANIVIDPKDTRDIAYGDYKYDIQLTTSSGAVQTILKPSTFKITEEVTFD